MSPEQNQTLQRITSSLVNVNDQWINYWLTYSNFATWQFWFNVLLLVGPLLFLYFTLDRKKAFHVGFFGFNVHIWFSYIDAYGVGRGLWAYPYKAVPFLPLSVSLDVAFVPVVFMLVYQWCKNHGKNEYLYLTGICVLFAFVFKPMVTALNLFQYYKWMNYFYLFLGYIIVMLLSKWITSLFVHFETEGPIRETSPTTPTFGRMKRTKI